MIDALLVCLAVLLAVGAVLAAPGPLMAVAASAALVLLLGSLAFRRTGLLVACGALLASCALSASLASPGAGIWQALAQGVGLFVLIDAGWDRLRLVPARFRLSSYAARLGAMGRVALLAAASVLAGVTLGYGTSAELGIGLPFWAALCAAAAAGLAGGALLLGALRRRRRESSI